MFKLDTCEKCAKTPSTHPNHSLVCHDSLSNQNEYITTVHELSDKAYVFRILFCIENFITQLNKNLFKFAKSIEIKCFFQLQMMYYSFEF